MKLQLNKKKMKSLTKNSNDLPQAVTPQVAGGWDPHWTQPAWRCMSYLGCVSNKDYC